MAAERFVRETLSADLIAERGFTVGFRGYDQAEVRQFLGRAAEEVRALRRQIEELEDARREAEARAARPPVLDEDTLMAAVGEETAAILRQARAAAADLRQRAEQEAAAVVDQARVQAGEIRAEAESALARATAEAERAAEAILGAAREEAAALLESSRRDAEALRQSAEQERRLIVEGAQSTREKILADLSRRRRVASVQIEQLRVGRERLLEAYAVVRRTLEEVNEELQRADSEARAAAEEAGRKLEAGGMLEERDSVAAPPLQVARGAHEAAGGSQDPEGRESPSPGEPEASGREVSSEAAGGGQPGPLRGAHDRSGPEVSSEAPGGGDLEVGTVPDEGSSTEARAIVGGGGRPESPAREREAGASGPAEGGGGSAEAHGAAKGGEGSGLAEGATPHAAPARSPGASGEGPDEVQRLFAKLRACTVAPGEGEAEQASASSQQPGLIIEGAVATADGPEPRASTDPSAAGEQPPHPAPESPPELGPEDAAGEQLSDEDERLLQMRDGAVVDVEVALTRRLKRALQDEQNDLLDRLRGHKGEVTAATLLPDPEAQAARFAKAAEPLLVEAAAAGASFAQELLGGSEGRFDSFPPPVDDLAAEAAASIVGPLRRRLEEAVGSAGEDQGLLVEVLGAAYREWKSHRIERIAGDALAAAFSRGTWHAVPEGTSLRWVVEDADGPCPDCDDNALAGYLDRGEPFPTGQPHPPAHTGCRCLLVPATTVAGS